MGAANKLLAHRKTTMTDKTATKPARRFARMPAEKDVPASAIAASATPRAKSKIALVTRLLERTEGVSLDELVVARGSPEPNRLAVTLLRQRPAAERRRFFRTTETGLTASPVCVAANPAKLRRSPILVGQAFTNPINALTTWCGRWDSNPHEQSSGDFKSPAFAIY